MGLFLYGLLLAAGFSLGILIIVIIISMLNYYFGWFEGLKGNENSTGNWAQEYKKEIEKKFIFSEEYARNEKINETLQIVKRIECSQTDNRNYYKDIIHLQKELLDKMNLYLYSGKK